MALDLSKSSPAPPPAKRKPSSSVKAATGSIKQREREESANGLFQVGAAICLMVKQPADANAFATHGPNIAHEMAVTAEHNEGFAKVLDYITAASPYAALLTACLPLAMQIMVNHNRLPAEPLASMGIQSPDALKAQFEAEVAKQQMQMMREAAEAQRESAELQAELAKMHASV